MDYIEKVIDAEQAGKRLDRVLAQMFDDYSRSRLQDWLKKGHITIEGQPAIAKSKVNGGETVRLYLDQAIAAMPVERSEAQAIDLTIVYEDEAIIVINKPAGLVVHPGAGNPDRTLVNALLHHDQSLEKLPRAGVIHRLDKDTSGLMVIARTLPVHQSLVNAMQERHIKREYHAVVLGQLVSGGTVDAPIGRHPRQRTKMAVVSSGKPAVTHYRVIKRFRAHTYVRCILETGRTHQIRVHMAHINYPLVGDPVYGGRMRLPPRASEELITALRGFKRQALHAQKLGLDHPLSGETMEWECPLPDDMTALIDIIALETKQFEKQDSIR